MSGKKSWFRNPIIVTSIISGVGGLLLVFLELYLRKSISSGLSMEGDVFLSLLNLVGLALFSGGILSVVLQLRDWTRYFEERLQNTVLKQEYLDSLDNETLTSLQVSTLKAYYKTEDIDKEGSFLNYFQNNLSKYINTPYRDDVKTEILVLSRESTGFWVSDRIIYNCRMVGGKMQDSVKWQPDEAEFLDIENVEIAIFRHQTDKLLLLSLKKEDGKYYLRKLAQDSTRLDDVEPVEMAFDTLLAKGFYAELDKYPEDGLIVEVKSKYLMENGKFNNWTMAHPTKNFYITINYPKEWKLRFQTLLMHPEKVIKTMSPGFFSMQYKEWLLPYSGIVYSFVLEV